MKMLVTVPSYNQGTFKLPWYNILRGGSRTYATSKMEHFVIIVNGFELHLVLSAKSWMLQQS